MKIYRHTFLCARQDNSVKKVGGYRADVPNSIYREIFSSPKPLLLHWVEHSVYLYPSTCGDEVMKMKLIIHVSY